MLLITYKFSLAGFDQKIFTQAFELTRKDLSRQISYMFSFFIQVKIHLLK